MFQKKNRLFILILLIVTLLIVFNCSIVPDQYQTLSSYQINYIANFPVAAPAIDCTGSMSSQTVTQGLEVNLSGNGFACVGYHLIGWTTQGAAGGVEINPGGVVAIGDSDLTLYGVWATNEQVTLRYDNNYKSGFDWGPTTITPDVMFMNSYTNLAANIFTLESHIFLGWSTNPLATTADYTDGDVFTIGLTDVTLYAVWLLNPQYPLYFNANDGAPTPVEISQDFRESETKTIDPNTFVYTGVSPEGIINTVVTGGRTFKGWRWSAAGLPTNIDLLDSDIYTYPPPGVVDPGDIAGTAPKLYAVWEDNPIHTITYNIDDGYGFASITQNFYEGEQKGLFPFVSTAFVPNLAAPQNFSGWAMSSTNNVANVAYSDEQNYTMGSGDITLYAVWTNNTYRTITYNGNSGLGVMSDQELPSGVNATLMSNVFFRSGYTFTGWSATAAPALGATPDYLNNVAVNLSADLNLYAIWQVNPPVQISYLIAGDMGSTIAVGVMTPQQIAEGSTVNLLANTFTRDGYSFAGWSRSVPAVNDLSTVSLSDEQSYFMAVGSTDFNLYPVWSREAYVVDFDGNVSGPPAVTNLPASQTVYFDTNVTNPPQPSRAGFDFVNWYREDTLITPWVFASETVNMGTLTSGTGLTLYAEWIPKSYTISYDSQGGSSVVAVAADFGTTVTVVPASPVKVGYVFADWYTDYPAFSNAWIFATDIVEGDQTLYAKWTPVSATITYDGNTAGGGLVPSVSGNSYDYDSNVTVASNTFLKTGFYFNGWNTATDGSGITYSPNTTFQMKSVDNMTFYAQWAENTNRLIYDGNGATAGSTPFESGAYHNFNATVPVALNTFNREGYIFTGWNTASDGSGVMYRETGNVGALTSIVMDNPSADITLYAQWLKGPEISITLPVEAGDGYINLSEKSELVTINITDADAACYKLGLAPTDILDGTPLVLGSNSINVDSLDLIAEGSVQIFVLAQKGIGSVTFDIGKSSTLFIYDITPSTISLITMPDEAADGYINNSEKGSTVFIQTTGDPTMVRVKTGGYPAGTSDGTRVNEFAGLIPINGVSGISEGAARQIYVRVWDAAGNFSSATSVAFTYDITDPTPPTITLPASATGGWINNAEKNDDITFGLAGGDAAVVRAQIGGVPATQTSGVAVAPAGDLIDISAISGISEGMGRQVSLRVWDLAGNYADDTSLAFNYDITPPTTPTITLPTQLNDGYSNIADAGNSVVITGSTGATTLRYKWMLAPAILSDGFDIATPTTGMTALLNTFSGLTSGSSRKLCVRAWDDAGNSSQNESAVFECDLEAPVIDSFVLPVESNPGVGTPFSTTGIAGATERWINLSEKDSLVTFETSDTIFGVGGLSVRCKIGSYPASPVDGTGLTAGISSIPISSINGITEGRSLQIYFKVWDSAGNSAQLTSLSFGYDITAPTGGSITDFTRTGSLLRDRKVTYTNVTDNLSNYAASEIAYMVSSRNGSKPDFAVNNGDTILNYWGNHSNTSQVTTCPFSPDYGTKYVRVWAVDEAGNVRYIGYDSK